MRSFLVALHPEIGVFEVDVCLWPALRVQIILEQRVVALYYFWWPCTPEVSVWYLIWSFRSVWVEIDGFH